MSTALQTTTAGSIQPILAMVLDTVSERSRRDYSRALTDFIGWYQETGQAGLSRAVVNNHVAHLKASGIPASSINQRLAAIRKLALEAADNGLIDEATAQSIKRVKNISRKGRPAGNWLTQRQATKMVEAPDHKTLLGLRDRAILAIMIGCGLRREEIAGLMVEDIQMRDDRWVILDLEGKHGRVRTVPMASWVKSLVTAWTNAAGINSGPLFRPFRKGDRMQDGSMTPQAIWNVVQRYSPVDNLAPHDLRRTFAKLAHKGGCPIEQIQLSLGHASIQTTERYLGVEQNLQNSPSDYIRLPITVDW